MYTAYINELEILALTLLQMFFFLGFEHFKVCYIINVYFYLHCLFFILKLG